MKNTIAKLINREPEDIVGVITDGVFYGIDTIPLNAHNAARTKVIVRGIPYEKRALERIAIAADGSMRDALTLLEQAIMSSGVKLLSREESTLVAAG